MKSRRPRDLAEIASDLFDLPVSASSDLPRVEISGGRRLLIEQHKGIIEYGPNEIYVNSSKGVIKVRGEALELRAMTANQLLVSGLLFGVEFEF